MKIVHAHARRRGSIGTYLVISLGAMLAVAVSASGSRIAPAAREARRTRTSDQAWSAAEGGLALARAILVLSPDYEGRRELRVDTVAVECTVTRTSDRERLAVAVARLQDPNGPAGDWITRVVEARFRVVPGEPPRVIDWQER